MKKDIEELGCIDRLYYETFTTGRLKDIEGYAAAKKDHFRGWVVSHRLCTHKYADRTRTSWVPRDTPISSYWLTMCGLFFNRPPKELIWEKINPNRNSIPLY